MEATKGAYVNFSQLKAAVDIEKVLERYDLLDDMEEKENGEGVLQLVGPNPFHEGTSTTAFKVTPDDQGWTIFQGRGDHISGNVLDLVCHLEDDLDPDDRKDLRQAALRLMEWFEIDGKGKPVRKSRGKPRSSKSRANGVTETPKDDEPVKAKRTERRQQAKPVSRKDKELPTENKPYGRSLEGLDREHEWLRDRDILSDTANNFDVGFREKGHFKDHIVFAVHSNAGDVIMCYAGIPIDGDEELEPMHKQLLWPKGWKRGGEIYNLHRALADVAVQNLVLHVVSSPLEIWGRFESGKGNYCAILDDCMSNAHVNALIETADKFDELVCLDISTRDFEIAAEQVKRLASHYLLHLHE